MSAERLQKILAHAGIASRRKAEELIELGLVTVNGKVAKLGDKADLQSDHIKVEGKLILRAEEPIYVAFYKPKGVISMMSDPEGRPTLADYLTKIRTRLFPIGRLDYNSEGLLLLTNDGDLAEKIQKSDEFPRAYSVKIKGHITSEMLARLERGARIEHKFIKPHSVRIAEELNKKTRVEISFISAANLDVKNYFETRGFLVERMVRVAIGHLTVKGLVPGQYRLMNKTQMEALVTQPDLGVKAMELAAEKQKEVLPTDLQVDRRAVANREAREERRPRARKPEASEDASMDDRPRRPFGERKPFGAKKSFGDRKPYGEKKPFGEKRGFGPKKPFGDRKKSFGDDDRSFGDRKPYGERKSFGDRKPYGEKRSFGDKKPFGEKRSFGDRKPYGEKRSFGDKKPFGEKRGFGGGKKSFGGERRPPRAGGGRGGPIARVKKRGDR